MRKLVIALTLLFLASCGGDNREDHITRARNFIDEGAYPSAMIELKNALQQDSQSAEARWLLGKMYLDAGDVLSAEKEILIAKNLGWPDNDIRPAMAKILLAQGKYEEALALSFTDLNSDAASQLLASQALAELSVGDYDKASALIEMALEKTPNSLTAKLVEARNLVHQGKYNRALKVADQVMKEAPSSAEAWRIKGQALLRLQRLEESRDAMNQAVEYSGGSLSDIATRALISLQLQDYVAAEADANKLLEISPKNPVGNFVKGLLHFNGKQYREAIAALTLAEPYAEDFPLALYYLSMAHLIEGSRDRATAQASKYVKLEPENINGRKLLATILIQQDELIQARDLIQPVLDYNSADLGALNIMANTLLLQGEVDQGLVLYARIKQLNADWSIAPLGLGAKLINPGLEQAQDQGIEEPEDTTPNFPQTDILIILEHLRQEDYDAAIAAAESYKWRDLTSLSPYHVLSRVHLAAGNKGKARQTLKKALKRDPGDPTSNLTLAKLALEKDDMKTARRHYQQVLHDYRDNLPALLLLASLDARNKNKDDMLLRLDQAANYHPNALLPRLRLAAYYLDRGTPSLVPPLFELMDVLQQKSPRVLEAIALSQLQQEHYAEAASTLEQLMSLHPVTARYHYLMATATSSLGNQASSEKQLLKAIELNPEHVPSLTRLTLLAEKNKKTEDFEKHFAQLLKVAPESPEALRIRARNEAQKGNLQEALALSELKLEKAPGPRAVLTLASYQKSAGQAGAARQTMKRWIEAHPDDVAIRLALATDYQKLNNLPAAQAQYKQILKYNSNNIIALNNLAWNLRRSRPAEALQYIQRAVSEAPDRADLQDTMAVVLHYNNERRAAYRHIRNARESDPENLSMRYHEAMIEATLGKKNSAIATLEELTTIPASEFPELQEARNLLKKLKP